MNGWRNGLVFCSKRRSASRLQLRVAELKGGSCSLADLVVPNTEAECDVSVPKLLNFG